MFCGNCGSQNPDGLTKCAVCGAPLTEEKKSGKAAKFDLKNMDRNKLTGYAVIAAVALVVVILLIVIFSGRSDTSTLKKYVKAAYDLDAKKIVNLYPDVIFKMAAEEEDISKGEAKDEAIDDLQDELEDLADKYDDIEFDEIKSIKVEIRDEDKLTKKQVRELNEMYEDEYDMKLKAKEMKNCEVKITGKHDGDKFNFKVNITLIKIGGSWYLMDPNCEALFSALLAEIND